jgi:hypothetical protein
MTRVPFWIAVGFIIVLVVLVGYSLTLAASRLMVLNPSGPLVENGVAMVMVCGKGDGFSQATEAVPNPRGTWSHEKQGDCNVWFHHPSARSGYLLGNG